jgi:hypothetical protein
MHERIVWPWSFGGWLDAKMACGEFVPLRDGGVQRL